MKKALSIIFNDRIIIVPMAEDKLINKFINMIIINII